MVAVNIGDKNEIGRGEAGVVRLCDWIHEDDVVVPDQLERRVIERLNLDVAVVGLESVRFGQRRLRCGDRGGTDREAGDRGGRQQSAMGESKERSRREVRHSRAS
jgi:hypothetical protein